MNEALKKITGDIKLELDTYIASAETRAAIEATEKAADTDAGTFEVVITTENLDRYNEVIKLDGWELEHYRNNPIVLWGHDHKQLPIGVATSVEVRDGKMIAKGKFALHEFAQTVRQLYDAGVMRATSVGFIEKEREGNLITKAELIEFSFVSVPANPYALSTMVKSGIHINEMVTKGFIIVKEEGGDSPESTETEPKPDEQPTDEPDEKKFDAKTISNLKQTLQEAIVALDALTPVEEEEPEGNEAPVEEDEETKRFRDFSEKRRVVQLAATYISDVLAEARKAVEAHAS